MKQGADCQTLIGRQAELRRLQEAIRKRESLLIWGPAGAGKTTLVAHALAGAPEEISQHCFHVSAGGTLQETLRELVRRLWEAGDTLIRKKFEADASAGGTIGKWVKAQTSLRLRGLLYRAAGEGRYWIFLDHAAPFSFAGARLLRELIWMRKTPVFLLARGRTENEIGKAIRWYWNDRQRLELGQLSLAAARKLLEHSIEACGLSRLDLTEFRDAVLQRSGLLPGAILKMCRLAAETSYQSDRRIKTKLVYVDYLLSQHVWPAPTGSQPHHHGRRTPS